MAMKTLDQLRNEIGDGRTCSKCGREKPRMDRSPCYRCVLDNIVAAERAMAELRAKWAIEAEGGA